MRDSSNLNVGNSGASLTEVLIAMVILLVAFLGMIALSGSLFNTNVSATNLNTAIVIGTSQMEQLKCLASQGKITTSNYGSIHFGLSNSDSYDIYPTIQSPDTRNQVSGIAGLTNPACIAPDLAAGSIFAPGSVPPSGMGITVPYTVSVNLQPFGSNLSATVTVSWNQGAQVIKFYNVLT